MSEYWISKLQNKGLKISFFGFVLSAIGFGIAYSVANWLDHLIIVKQLGGLMVVVGVLLGIYGVLVHWGIMVSGTTKFFKK